MCGRKIPRTRPARIFLPQMFLPNGLAGSRDATKPGPRLTRSNEVAETIPRPSCPRKPRNRGCGVLKVAPGFDWRILAVSIQSRYVSRMKRRPPIGVGLDLGPCREIRTDRRSQFPARTKVRPYTLLHRYGSAPLAPAARRRSGKPRHRRTSVRRRRASRAVDGQAAAPSFRRWL